MGSSDKDSFVFYRSFYEALQQVPKTHRTAIYEACFTYVFESRDVSLSGVPGALWALIKPQLDASQRRYENAKKGAEHGKKGAEYGKLGGRPKKEKPPLRGNEQNPLNVNVNDNSNVNSNVNVNSPSPGVVINTHNRPTMSDVLIRFAQDGREGAHDFWKYNEAKGWIYDFETAYRKWCEKDQQKKQPEDKNRFNNFHQREYDMDFERKLLAAQKARAE